MDSIPLAMDDIFGEEDDVEDFSPSRLPDLEDELEPMRDVRNDDENAEGETDNAELMAKLKSMKGASKNATRRTIPKLDATRLTGERGIPILPKVFKNVPLKGKNHEKEDLKIIMQTLEHWGHRLFPKMTFPEVLERVERLGIKKDVQSCVKRIRLDMPVLVTDSVQDDEEEAQKTDHDDDKEDGAQRDEQSSKENEIDDEEIEDLLREQMLPVSSLSKPDDSSSQSNVVTKTGLNDITDELKARIQQNKKLALERRAAKLAKINKGDSPNETIHSDQPSEIITTVNSSSTEDESAKRMSCTAIIDQDEALCETLPESVADSEAHTDSIHEQIHCDESATELQHDKLFNEDSDSEMLHMVDA